MSALKHTPGPWSAEIGDGGEFGDWAEIHGPGRVHPIAEIAMTQGTPFGLEDEANAILIAAAPDLLKALRRIAAKCSAPHKEQDDCTCCLARAAIAKAEGRS